MRNPSRDKSGPKQAKQCLGGVEGGCPGPHCSVSGQGSRVSVGCEAGQYRRGYLMQVAHHLLILLGGKLGQFTVGRVWCGPWHLAWDSVKPRYSWRVPGIALGHARHQIFVPHLWNTSTFPHPGEKNLPWVVVCVFLAITSRI